MRLMRVGSLCVGSFQFVSTMYEPASASAMLLSDSSRMRSTNAPSAWRCPLLKLRYATAWLSVSKPENRVS